MDLFLGGVHKAILYTKNGMHKIDTLYSYSRIWKSSAAVEMKLVKNIYFIAEYGQWENQFQDK